ncbi:MAG: hypothetical protein K2M37_07155 [Muribaculaceae bacterium]|nr:hypothetical protein [Muribaculaceae bacterium]
MKQFYNYIAILMLMLAFGSARAEESRLFSQDYTWSYRLAGEFHSVHWWNLKFGEPTERNEQVYRPFEFVKSDYYENYPYNGYFIPYKAAEEFPPCLIREDNGKVFGIIPKEYLSDAWVLDNNYDDSQEYMLYDFSCGVGDRYNTLSNFGEVIEVEVAEVSSIELSGSTRKLQTVKYPAPHDNSTFQVIEDIGIVSDGFFPYLNTILYTGAPMRAPGAARDVRVQYILDSEGNCAYGSPFLGYKTTINAGRTWEYIACEPIESGFRYTLDSYSFDNVRPYKLMALGDWMHLSHSEWEVTTEDGVEKVMRGKTVPVNQYVITLAEENGRVMTVPSVAENDWEEPTENSDKGSPYVLYDYTYRAKLDATFELSRIIREDGNLNFLTIDVKTTERETNNETMRQRLCVTPVGESTVCETGYAEYVESVGNVGAGDMLTLKFQEPSNGDVESGFARCFNRLLDASGEVIYEGKNIEVPSFAGLADTGIEAEHPVIYDLFGREIADPQPGTVYIRNGRKFVQR